MTHESSLAYSQWHNKNILKMVDCPICGHLLRIIATDSSGREIVEPCQPCHLAWRTKHQLAASEMKTICDECGGKLRVRKKDKAKVCMNKKCGEVYL